MRRSRDSHTSIHTKSTSGALGFWIGIIAAPVVGIGLLALQFQRSMQLSGDSWFAWGITGVLVLSVAPTVILVFAIINIVGGWTTRNARIRADPEWALVLSAFSTEELGHVLRSAFPATATPTYGISISAGSRGVALWRGRTKPEMILFWAWSDVIGFHASTMRIVTDNHVALTLVVPAPWGAAQLTLPLLGSYPFGARPMAPRELERTVVEIAALRDGSWSSAARSIADPPPGGNSRFKR